jgi:hypothetical protein
VWFHHPGSNGFISLLVSIDSQCLKHDTSLSLSVCHLFVYVRGPFGKFVNSPYYSESEICGGAVTVQVPPLASDALLTTLHPLLENVLQTVDHLEISCLIARRDLDCMADVLMGFSQAEHRIQFRSRPIRFLGFSNHEKGAPRQARNFEMINGL